MSDNTNPPKPPITPSKESTTQKVNVMDVVRAQDASSRKIVRAATEDGYDNFLSRIGLNNENLLSGGTYEFNLVTRNRILLEAAYRGSWVVGRAIDSVANDMTRAGIEITTSDKTYNKEVFKKAMTRLQIWQSICTTIKWGRLYGGSLGVMQIAGQQLDTPLNPETISKGQFQGIAVFDRWMLNPVLTPVIETGPNIGLPKFYQIVSNPQSYDPNSQTATGQLNVHHTRCIRYTGIDLPFFQAITEMMWGESILERLWDRLIGFDNTSMSAAQLVDRANLRTVGIEGLREIIAAGAEAQRGLEAHFEMMRRMADNEGLTLLDKNDTFQSTAYSFAGLSDMMLQFAQQVSGACEIPLVVLFGQPPAGLGSTADADLRIYYDNINAQQEAKLREPFSTLIKVMWRSTFGSAVPEDMDFSFTPLWQMDPLDKANIAKTNTETIIGAHEAGLVPVATSMKELKGISGDTGVFSNITDEDIADAELEEPPFPNEPTEMGEPQAPTPSLKEPIKSLDKKIPAWTRIAAWLNGN